VSMISPAAGFPFGRQPAGTPARVSARRTAAPGQPPKQFHTIRFRSPTETLSSRGPPQAGHLARTLVPSLVIFAAASFGLMCQARHSRGGQSQVISGPGEVRTAAALALVAGHNGSAHR